MKDGYKIKIDGVEKVYPKGTTFEMLAKEYQKSYQYDIVLAVVDQKLQELFKEINQDCEVAFITTADKIGHMTYRRSATHMLIKAVYDVAGHDNVEQVRILYSVSKGYYCTVKGDVQMNQEFLNQVEARMRDLVEQELPIKKRSMNTDEAVELFKSHGMKDKERLFKYRRVSKVNIYSMNEFEDYYYGYMVINAGYLKYFALYLYDEGFVIQLPVISAPTEVPPFKPQNKLFQIFKESTKMGDMLNVDTVGALNDIVVQGKMNELILVQEAFQEKKLTEIASRIAANKDIKFVLVAGPSSSGKTTFSHRLSIQLRAHGLKPHPIAADNYFVEREFTPIDEFGEPDFESIKALDVEKLNEDLSLLLSGKTVEIPNFNFKTGKREYNNNNQILSLKEDDILILEGIHCLNDKMSYSLPKENKFKVYISALTQLNIDEHNRIPTTDGRMIRRMVRDARTRGTSARETLAMWASVRRGEEQNIFPYQEEADVMFNSALIYELAVLKQYAEPILFGIPKESKEYYEAKRLLKFFDYFIGVGDEYIPKNSLLREFIGGSCF